MQLSTPGAESRPRVLAVLGWTVSPFPIAGGALTAVPLASKVHVILYVMDYMGGGALAVTYWDIARHASVSTATVSRVLTGSGFVSDEVADRVRASADALGYRSNRAARAL